MRNGEATPASNGLGNVEASASFMRSSKLMFLKDWWLIKTDPDSHGRRLGVAGVSSKGNGVIRNLASSAILKRHDTVTLETVDGITVIVNGLLNKARTYRNGFPSEVFDHFITGFPYYWEEFTALSFEGKQQSTRSSPYKTPRKTNSRKKEQVHNTAECTGPITRSRSGATITKSQTSEPIAGSRSTSPDTKSRTSNPITGSRSTGPITRSRRATPVTRNRTSDHPVTRSRSTGPITRSRSAGPVTRSQSRLTVKLG